jgi:hypothetical protein
LNQHLSKATKSLKKSSFIWRLPGPPASARFASYGSASCLDGLDRFAVARKGTILWDKNLRTRMTAKAVTESIDTAKSRPIRVLIFRCRGFAENIQKGLRPV